MWPLFISVGSIGTLSASTAIVLGFFWTVWAVAFFQFLGCGGGCR
ncbi:MAG: hypothetical protein ACLFN4_03745 [Candidatus Acetothermia bacterium]